MAESTPANPNPAAPESAPVVSLPIAQIQPSSHQARKTFDEQKLQSLARTIQEEGLLQAITVRPVGDHYELISGERRLRAMKLLGKTAIDARVIHTVSEGEAAAKGLIENIQREDLNPMEEAEGFAELNQLDPVYWTHEKIAEIVGGGRGRTYVTMSLKLLSLTPAVQDYVRRQTLSRDHGLEIARLPNGNSQKSIAEKVLKGGWSAKKTREAIDRKLAKKDQTLANQGSGPAEDPVLPRNCMQNHQQTPEIPDPLDDLWVRTGPAMGSEFAACEINYEGDDTWTFRIQPYEGSPQKNLTDWFREMADALAQNAKK